MKLAGVLVMALVLTACGGGESAEDNLTGHACDDYRRALQDAADGISTEAELRDAVADAFDGIDFAEANQRARTAMHAALAALTSSRASSDQVTDALLAADDACSGFGTNES